MFVAYAKGIALAGKLTEKTLASVSFAYFIEGKVFAEFFKGFLISAAKRCFYTGKSPFIKLVETSYGIRQHLFLGSTFRQNISDKIIAFLFICCEKNDAAISSCCAKKVQMVPFPMHLLKNLTLNLLDDLAKVSLFPYILLV